MMSPSKKPFASVVQSALIGLLLVSFLLIVQRFSGTLFRIGFILLIATTFVQIAFGNIQPTAGVGKSLKILAVTFGIIAALFAVGIWIAPFLVKMGQG